MKILVDNLEKEYPKKCICENCKSIIEIDESDVKDITINSYDPREREHFKYSAKGFKCPVCNKNTKVITT